MLCGHGITSRHLNGADPLEHAGHVALGIVAVGQRLLLVAERKAAKKDQPGRVVIFPQPPGGPLAAGLLDDGQQIALDLDVAEERLEAFVRLALGGRLAELDQAAIIASRSRRRARPGSNAASAACLPCGCRPPIALAGIVERLLPGQPKPRDPVLVGIGRDQFPNVGLWMAVRPRPGGAACGCGLALGTQPAATMASAIIPAVRAMRPSNRATAPSFRRIAPRVAATRDRFN